MHEYEDDKYEDAHVKMSTSNDKYIISLQKGSIKGMFPSPIFFAKLI